MSNVFVFLGGILLTKGLLWQLVVLVLNFELLRCGNAGPFHKKRCSVVVVFQEWRDLVFWFFL